MAKRKAVELEHVGTDSTSEEGQKRHNLSLKVWRKFGSLESRAQDKSFFV